MAGTAERTAGTADPAGFESSTLANHSNDTPAHIFPRPFQNSLADFKRNTGLPIPIVSELYRIGQMTYDLFVSGTPKKRIRVDRDPIAGRLGAPKPLLRRFPPVLQFLTTHSPDVEARLRGLCLDAYRRGKSLEDICSEIYNFAFSLGYEATIGVQEVYSSSMPSFPQQTVMSALLLIDLQSTYDTNGESMRRAG